MWTGLRRGARRLSDARSKLSSTELRRAGFSSFAYRLAHLTLPRPMTVAGVFCLFYFG
ncbi:MAG: hypothetical protein P4M09_10290 [Devosia sp.]|nr:hypothetical protein [Devosia sp.]